MAGVGHTEIYLDKNNEYRWRMVAGNGRIVADSGEGYKTKANAKKGLQTVEYIVTLGETADLTQKKRGKAARANLPDS